VNVDVEPLRVDVSRGPAGRSRVDIYDARQLFDQAGVALDADRYDQALALYDRMVAAFPGSPLVPAALFNAGLALEGKRDLAGAAARYLEVVRRAPTSRHGLDAQIRAGAVMAELERWAEALSIYDEVAARRDLVGADRIEVLARRGYVLVELARYPEAGHALSGAIELADRANRERTPARDSFAAMAHYYLGEIPRRTAEEVRLELPEARLEERIEAKAKLVLVAQRRFEDTIRVGDLVWATAAGYQLGAMQQDMWRSLLAAPIPPLKPDEVTVYTTEVRGLAHAHLEKALAAHRMNVSVADRNGARTPWSERSRQRIKEIRLLLAGGPVSLRGPPPVR
jgi:tetratricopeptide (TPR) repeat protein